MRWFWFFSFNILCLPEPVQVADTEIHISKIVRESYPYYINCSGSTNETTTYVALKDHTGGIIITTKDAVYTENRGFSVEPRTNATYLDAKLRRAQCRHAHEYTCAEIPHDKKNTRRLKVVKLMVIKNVPKPNVWSNANYTCDDVNNDPLCKECMEKHMIILKYNESSNISCVTNVSFPKTSHLETYFEWFYQLKHQDQDYIQILKGIDGTKIRGNRYSFKPSTCPPLQARRTSLTFGPVKRGGVYNVRCSIRFDIEPMDIHMLQSTEVSVCMLGGPSTTVPPPTTATRFSKKKGVPSTTTVTSTSPATVAAFNKKKSGDTSTIVAVTVGVVVLVTCCIALGFLYKYVIRENIKQYQANAKSSAVHDTTNKVSKTDAENENDLAKKTIGKPTSK